MPELPEVETIVRNLREGTAGCFALPGLTISGFTLSWQKTLAVPAAEELEESPSRTGDQGCSSAGKIHCDTAQPPYYPDTPQDVW